MGTFFVTVGPAGLGLLQKYQNIGNIDGFPIVKILEFRELSALCLGNPGKIGKDMIKRF